MATPEKRAIHGHDLQFAANHLGHFALATQLLPSLLNAGARVVSLSSSGHRISPVRFDDIKFEKEPYDKWVAYGQSKTANSLFAVGLNTRFQKEGLSAFAVHPGGIMTPLQRHLPQEEMVALGWINADGSMPDMIKALFKTPAQGASTTVFAALAKELDGLGGVYLEDCNIAQLADEESQRFHHVKDYAVDTDLAEQLWQYSENVLAL